MFHMVCFASYIDVQAYEQDNFLVMPSFLRSNDNVYSPHDFDLCQIRTDDFEVNSLAL